MVELYLFNGDVDEYTVNVVKNFGGFYIDF